MSENLLDDDFNKQPKVVRLASFGDRVLASVIDTLIFVPFIFLTVYNWTDLKIYYLDLLLNLAIIFYKPLLEWNYGATIGKMLAKIKVVGTNLQNISLDQSFMRFSIYSIGYGISLLASNALFQDPAFQEATTFVDVGALQQDSPFNEFSQIASFATLVSIMFVAFDIKKQALHDKLAGTLVIKVNPES